MRILKKIQWKFRHWHLEKLTCYSIQSSQVFTKLAKQFAISDTKNPIIAFFGENVNKILRKPRKDCGEIFGFKNAVASCFSCSTCQKRHHFQKICNPASETSRRRSVCRELRWPWRQSQQIQSRYVWKDQILGVSLLSKQVECVSWVFVVLSKPLEWSAK